MVFVWRRGEHTCQSAYIRAIRRYKLSHFGLYRTPFCSVTPPLPSPHNRVLGAGVILGRVLKLDTYGSVGIEDVFKGKTASQVNKLKVLSAKT